MNKKDISIGTLLGKNIADRRNALGLTQAQLAEMIKADTVTVSRFERGSHLPSLVRLELIAQVLEMPLAELLSQSTNLSTDMSLQIQGCLDELSDSDGRFVLEMVKGLCERLRFRE